MIRDLVRCWKRRNNAIRGETKSSDKPKGITQNPFPYLTAAACEVAKCERRLRPAARTTATPTSCADDGDKPSAAQRPRAATGDEPSPPRPATGDRRPALPSATATSDQPSPSLRLHDHESTTADQPTVFCFWNLDLW
nr:hypothetical protein Iba_chr15bCG11250 [Ipomoea batatas]